MKASQGIGRRPRPMRRAPLATTRPISNWSATIPRWRPGSSSDPPPFSFLVVVVVAVVVVVVVVVRFDSIPFWFSFCPSCLLSGFHLRDFEDGAIGRRRLVGWPMTSQGDAPSRAAPTWPRGRSANQRRSNIHVSVQRVAYRQHRKIRFRQ